MTARGLASLAERAGFDLRVYRDTAELFTAWVPVVPSYSGSVAGCWDWLADRLAHDGDGSAL
ncbi:Uncharacterised protein [Mycobacteroides abscessus subsp. abscessus]|uniref:hypothetical protein n=1 Tax=Mycobacteroides abscessus TaxID=36809 RepID=UPI00092C698D|nr:hypothetical protein [Mycobacteroides abscessus]SHT46275.1 Uncharacterised protein [Mycobacteroides abscessus subsp. abscessus]SHW32611.1 Uncharacterised protein [Mycobacteroides abscessus subsp. abscessus]SIF92070.1 Uncharacterised protein [Mycobacteroides abscessus subsp. abscessus]SKD17768.1 Uncharacterised protein [Mycobacteroides abscessus subsp. abscessus]SKM22831.1 Uncharacterised protein [Mycobacteroides abscessus subsp. abscessus]